MATASLSAAARERTCATTSSTTIPAGESVSFPVRSSPLCDTTCFSGILLRFFSAPSETLQARPPIAGPTVIKCWETPTPIRCSSTRLTELFASAPGLQPSTGVVLRRSFATLTVRTTTSETLADLGARSSVVGGPHPQCHPQGSRPKQARADRQASPPPGGGSFLLLRDARHPIVQQLNSDRNV